MIQIICTFIGFEVLAYLSAGNTPIAGDVYFWMGVAGILVGAAIADAEKKRTTF